MRVLVPALTAVALAALAYAFAADAGCAQGRHALTTGESARAPAPAAQASDAAAQAPKLAPRTRVAGLDSLRVTSSIRFSAPKAAPHELEVSLAFPARARLALRPVGAQLGERVLRYVRGDEVYGFGLREATSTRLEGAARVDELLGIEARRAAFVWPEAHTWGGEGAERRAELAGLGALEAQLEASAVSSPSDPDGKDSDLELRPRRIRALRADGTEVETLEITGWRRFEVREGARVWPRGLRLSVGGAVVWDEEVQLVDRPVPWPDEWFVPPDLRTPRDAAVPGLRAIDLPSVVVREVDVPRVAGRPSSIDAALAFARRVAAEERAAGRALDVRTTLVISRELEPRKVRLVLADEHASVPEGWRLEPAQPAWLVFFDSAAEVAQRDVDRLQRAAPTTAPNANLTFLLVVTGEPKGGVQLVLVDAPR